MKRSIAQKISPKAIEHRKKLHEMLRSEEGKRKMSEACKKNCGKSKPVIAITREGTTIGYASITVASKYTKVSKTAISKCCRGIIKTAGGYYWEYLEKEQEK